MSDWSSDVCSADLIGVKATGIQNGIAHFQEARQRMFQLLVASLRSANETHRRQAKTRCIQPLLGGLDKPPVVGQAKIVVGAEIQHIIAVRQVHLRSEEHTSELQSLMRISYAVLCLKQKHTKQN